MKFLVKIASFFVMGMLAVNCFPAFAQENYEQRILETTDSTRLDSLVKEYKALDYTLELDEAYNSGILETVEMDTLNPQVVVNKFGKNWFVFATGGVHTFRGDYSSDGKFRGTLSPDWGLGVGKWFTPGVGLKVEWIRSNSRGYTEFETGHYGHGNPMYKDDGTPYYQTKDGVPYRKMRTGWWDASASVILNLSRLFLGYEGYDSPRLMGQFMLNLGIGGVHHMGYSHDYGSDNEWSGHVEFQYSQFFTRKKKFSLDIKARGLFYQTNFDLEYGQAAHSARKFDYNVGIDIGFTFYLGKNRWRPATVRYLRDYRERDVLMVREKNVETGILTFYVFYPNNYSGRSDAPLILGSEVNALDYLAGGIFTQKRYVNSDEVAGRLARGQSLNGLAIEDIPTEAANQNFKINYVPRGYEMSTLPMSLSLKAEDMNAFREKSGFYYAPLYDGIHTWQYRIDNETLKQQLLSNDNYMETASYGLNAHSGLDIIRKNMDCEGSDILVSFADVYAAMTSNEGYVSRFTDPETVEFVRKVLEEGIITVIQTEGLATSQDNYTGANAEQVGIERNTALSQNRANTVISWLKSKEQLNDVTSQIFLVNNMGSGIRTVTDKSTRGLDAKLNRCVKVRIHYMIK